MTLEDKVLKQGWCSMEEYNKLKVRRGMTKKRKTAIAILSPLLIAMGVAVLIVACISYAISGKWEFRTMIKELGV